MSASRASEHPPADTSSRHAGRRDSEFDHSTQPSARGNGNGNSNDNDSEERRERSGRPGSRASPEHDVSRRSRHSGLSIRHSRQSRERALDSRADHRHPEDWEYGRRRSRRSRSSMRRSLGYQRRCSPRRRDCSPSMRPADDRHRGQRHADKDNEGAASSGNCADSHGEKDCRSSGYHDRHRQSLRRESYHRSYRKRSRTRSPSQHRRAYKRHHQDYYAPGRQRSVSREPSRRDRERHAADYYAGSRARSRHRSPTRGGSSTTTIAAVSTQPSDSRHPKQNGFGNTRDESLLSGRYSERRRSRSRASDFERPVSECPAPPSSSPPPPPPPPPSQPQHQSSQTQLQTAPHPQPQSHSQQHLGPAAAFLHSQADSRAHSQTPPPPPPPPLPASTAPMYASETLGREAVLSSETAGNRAGDSRREQQHERPASRHAKQSPRYWRLVAEGGAANAPVGTNTSTSTNTGTCEAEAEAEDEGGIGTPVTPTTPKARSPVEGIQLYSRICMVGEGTYGKVYKARNRETSQVVALKRMRIDMDREGFPITAMREIRLLKQLQHPNITQVLDVVPESGSSVYVVMEYMDYDLSGLINHPQWCPEPAHKKSLMQQLLRGLEFMHARGILHRDIKGSNLLINQHGQIKYVDFGLARSFHHTRMQEFTNRVITLWYRPPELLLGTTVYGPEVDIWSLGCVILELFLKKPAFQGQNDIDQLEQIFKMLGTPSPKVWDSFKKLPWACYMTPSTRYEECLRATLSTRMTADAVDLISWMLSLSPSMRPSAKECLAHKHFIEDPEPVPPTSFPVNGDWHEYESKLERRKRKQAAKTQQQQQQQQRSITTNN